MGGWTRFVAIGDSFTEGVGDPGGLDGRWRGWADLVAEQLARHAPGVRYANLAVRGLRVEQILERQLPAAERMAPDLVTICAAGNDFLRPRVDPDDLADRMEHAVGRLRAADADVVLFTSFDPHRMRVLRRRRGLVAVYNENLHAVAERHGARVMDMWAMAALTHPRARVGDRLHLSPEAHRRVALHVCEVLGLPVDGDWRAPWSGGEPFGWFTRRRQDLTFLREHLLPWSVQRLTHRPEGQGRTPKRPDLTPVVAPDPGRARP